MNLWQQPPRKSHRGHSNCGQEVEGDASDTEARPTKCKHKGKVTSHLAREGIPALWRICTRTNARWRQSTATMRDSPVASSSRANTHKVRRLSKLQLPLLNRTTEEKDCKRHRRSFRFSYYGQRRGHKRGGSYAASQVWRGVSRCLRHGFPSDVKFTVRRGSPGEIPQP